MSRVRLHGAQFALGALLAFTLWTYVSFTTNPTQTRPIRVPVSINGLEPGLLIVDAATGLPEQIAASATVTAMGPEDDLATLDRQDVLATADLSGLGPGLHQVPIDVVAPTFVRIQGTEPTALSIVLARERVSTVPVEIRQDGQPPFSFTAGSITQGATEAIVRGPEERVREVSSVVGILDLQGQTQDVRSTLPLEAVDAEGEPVEGITISPEQVRVQVPIVAQVDVQQVSVVPDIKGEPAPGYAVGRIDWDPKIVEVFTSGGVTGTLSTEPITLTGLTDPITRTVGLGPLPNVITRSPNVAITVRVSIVPIVVQSQLPLFVPVGHTNLGEDLNVSADPGYVRLTLSGPFEQLSQLLSDEITATVDLQGLTPGVYTLPVELEFPDGLGLIERTNPTVRVAIWSEAPPSTPVPTKPPAQQTPAPGVTEGTAAETATPAGAPPP